MLQSLFQSDQSDKKEDIKSARKENGKTELSDLLKGHDMVGRMNSGPVLRQAQQPVRQAQQPVQQAQQPYREDEQAPGHAPRSLSLSKWTGAKAISDSMPEDVQSKMENSFATSFAEVKVRKEDSSATQMGALAYTQGNEVHFAPGQYNPNSQAGQELLGHELTHVIQQRQGRVKPTRQGKGMSINDNPSLENEADLMGKRAARGERNNAPTQLKKEAEIQLKGELGLENGSVNRDSGGVEVTGETAEGEQIRPVNYQDESAYNRSEGLINDLQANAATHAFFEYVAHFLAYQEPGYEPPESVRRTIETNGYVFDHIFRGRLGFQYVLLRSTNGQNNIVAFRGTNPGLRPSDLATIYADTDPTAVGYQQYRNNRAKINELFSLGTLDIAGHSLGGALAQIVAAYHTSQVDNVYTFQAPGIDSAMVARFNETDEEDRPNVYHHVAVGDMVDKAGEQNLPGNVYVHDFGVFWIQTQELLRTSGQKLSNFGRNVGGVISESNSISQNVALGLLESSAPLVRDMLLERRVRLISQDIEDLNNYITNAKAEARELKTLIGNVIGGIGEAHLSFLFSSGNFADARAQAGIEDDFYTNSGGDEGAGKERVNEASVVSAHESYPFQDERESAETIRDVAGTAVNMVINPEFIFAAYRTIDMVIAALEAVKNAMIALGELIAQLLTDAWEAIKSIPGLIREQLAEIGRWISYLNSLEFWRDLYYMR